MDLSIERGSALACCPHICGPCRTSKPAAPPVWAANSIIVPTATSNAIAITPARTATVPSVRTNRQINGSRSNRVCYCQLNTFSSPSPSPRNCEPSPAHSRRPSTTCSSALLRKPYNNWLCKLENGNVTFSYKESASEQLKHCTVTAAEFIRRFLQHVLPHRFIKVRYYGLLSPAHRQLLQKARQLLSASTKPKRADLKTTKPLALLSCPLCRGPLTLLGLLAPRGRAP